MPKYISLINFTNQGIKDVKNLPQRVQAAREAIEKAGGKLIDWNLTMGEYDVVAISEAPNDSIAALIGLALGSQGNLRTNTLKAFTLAEATAIISKLP
mgnify:CR=1 FL=1|tara:strand:- start:316 stop:609 length:294 start_codon:yes stop_codon:yes gene_type:complete